MLPLSREGQYTGLKDRHRAVLSVGSTAILSPNSSAKASLTGVLIANYAAIGSQLQ